MARRKKDKKEQKTKVQNEHTAQNNDNMEQKEEPEVQEQEQKTEEGNCEQQVAELQDKYLRLYSDFENYKKRAVKDRLETLATASKDVVKALLPVLDDFDRARANSKDDAFDQGFGLIYKKLYHLLEREGLKPMESTGKPFNPELHEAISKLPASAEEDKGLVLDTVEKGYFFKDKILRYAKVVVAE